MSEHDDDDGGLPPPDWNRYRVESRAYSSSPKAPVGDPLRWGGQARMVVSSGGPAQTSEQFLRAQTADTYGRLWAITGTVRANLAMWALPAADWILSLNVTQGSGQATISQNFNLRLLTDIGLASAYFEVPEFVGGGVVRSTRSFAIIGGVIGQNWNARAFSTGPTGVFVNEEVLVTAIACPLAAGTKL